MASEAAEDPASMHLTSALAGSEQQKAKPTSRLCDLSFIILWNESDLVGVCMRRGLGKFTHGVHEKGCCAFEYGPLSANSTLGPCVDKQLEAILVVTFCLLTCNFWGFLVDVVSCDFFAYS